MYKLKDGPIDYFFCSDTHALEWLDYRHRNLEINKFLRLLPLERARVLKGRTIDEFILSALGDEVGPTGGDDGATRSCNDSDGEVSMS